MKTQVVCWCIAALLSVCGCANSDTSISGTVKLDGKPVAQGDIRFIPMEGVEGADAGAVIQDGKYKVIACGLAEGKYRVSIRGYERSGRVEPDPLGGPPIKGSVQIVPKEYRGEDSQIAKEITRGSNRLDFELISSGTTK